MSEGISRGPDDRRSYARVFIKDYTLHQIDRHSGSPELPISRSVVGHALFYLASHEGYPVQVDIESPFKNIYLTDEVPFSGRMVLTYGDDGDDGDVAYIQASEDVATQPFERLHYQLGSGADSVNYFAPFESLLIPYHSSQVR